MRQQIHTFTSGDSRCSGTLFLPEVENPPVVLMGHGYGAEQSFGLQPYAKAFVARGMAAFTFDYRYFGASEGEPRRLLDPKMQIQDWLSALAFMRQLPSVDSNHIGLWGSSLGGGHALTIAAQEPVQATVAQVPHCCARSAFRNVGLHLAAKGTVRGLYDQIRHLFGLSPYRVAILGDDSDGYAVMSHPDWKQQYLDMVPADSKWQNDMPARSLLAAGNYSPIDQVQNIECPTLIVYGDRDAGVPVDSVENTIKKIRHCESYVYKGDHFEVYEGGSAHHQVINREADFLADLLVAGKVTQKLAS